MRTVWFFPDFMIFFHTQKNRNKIALQNSQKKYEVFYIK